MTIINKFNKNELSCNLEVIQRNGIYNICLLHSGKIVLFSPEEGLWSIALGWSDSWPAKWQHAHPESVEGVDDIIVVKGRIRADDGQWILRDAYISVGRYVKCIRRFTWKGEKPAEACTLSVRWQISKSGADALLPGILYYGNPSGSNSGRVPVYNGKPGEEAIFEEHRFPMPFSSLEWEDDGQLYGAALHSLPSPLAYGNRTDQWWSLGVKSEDDLSEIMLLSGPCASNGKKSVVKGIQGGFLDYSDAYLRVPPGGIIEKTFFLEVYPVNQKGTGFQKALCTSLDIFKPFSYEEMPTFHEIIKSKYRYAKSRWHEGPNSAGFRKFPDRNEYVMGWCGQAAALGYALMVLEDELNDPEIKKMVQKSLDFLTNTPFNDDGFLLWYHPDDDKWDNQDPVSQGQAMENFARAILYGRDKVDINTEKWERFLERACDVHSRRIISDNWRPKSTNEGFIISPLYKAFQLFHKEEYKKAAIKAAEHYAERHLNMKEPYWGGTLDARCEDKEGAWAGFQAFLAIYEMTKEEKYLKWAKHAMDVMLTYTVVWDINMPPGRLADHGFKSRGWTAVSVQNMHLDVYGIMATPDIYRMGQILGRDDLKKLAILMYRSCGQLIDPYGSQGEQIQQTNYGQHERHISIDRLRGNYVETWTVFWITAHFLNAAAQFVEMGVSLTE